MGFGDFFGGEHREAAENMENPEHKGEWTHEALAGGAAFVAMREYEKKYGGKHAMAKEILAGLAGAEVDKLCETKGLDYIDREKAKHHAKREAERAYDEQYGNREDAEWAPEGGRY